MTETETVISDDKLLDLYLTAWVAGAFETDLRALGDPTSRDHVMGCQGCTARAIDMYSARLVALWEDPAARAETIGVFRAVIANETRPPKFITVHTPARGN